MITKLDFEPAPEANEAGLWIINGSETHQVKVVGTMNSENKNIIAFSFVNNIDQTKNVIYEVEDTIGSVVWLRLMRDEHKMMGYYSADGNFWTQIEETINAAEIDVDQTDFNDFTGNQQGLYTKGKTAYFDLYVYRYGYTPISAADPANKYKTTVLSGSLPPYILGGINAGDWVMYAGVEFGNDDYQKQADSISVIAACSANGGSIDVLLDSLTSTKIAELQLSSTSSWNKYKTFTTNLTGEVSGNHDVYMKFKGSLSSELFRLKTITFIDKDLVTSAKDLPLNEIQGGFKLEINYPSPAYSIAKIKYTIPKYSFVSLKVYSLNGTEITTLFEGFCQPGDYVSTSNGQGLTNGIYLCRLEAENYSATKKLMIVE